MGSTPTTTNDTATKINTVIARANSVGTQLVESLIIADQPWLGWPGIKQIFEFILGKLDGYLSKAEQAGATFSVIDSQVGAEDTALGKARAALQAAQKSGDPNALKQAEQAYADAQSSLVHYDGSAKPQ